MKLVSRDESGCVFLMGKRERQMMLNLLKKYPVLSTSHCKASRNESAETAESERLLKEALAEQQKENKRQLEKMLAEPGRFEDLEVGCRFRLKPTEVEWLLQVFNDIRVGSWVKLGSPDPRHPASTPLTEENVKLSWSMEIAGLFESELLQAMESSE